jgi:hypothetical protein
VRGCTVAILVIAFMHGVYSYVPETNYVSGVYNVGAVMYLLFVLHVMLWMGGGSERLYSCYPCYHIITVIIIVTQFNALNIPKQFPLHLHQQSVQLDLYLNIPYLLTIPCCSNTNNNLQRLPVRTFYSARHQTTHHLELTKTVRQN